MSSAIVYGPFAENKEWIGVDLDGTLAVWGQEEEPGNGFIGPPVPAMMDRVWRWINEGELVKIVTARANYSNQVPYVLNWLYKHGLGFLTITPSKDCYMKVLYDDRAIQVERNTGRLIGEV